MNSSDPGLKRPNFKMKWETEFFVTLNADLKPQCLICKKVMSKIKSFNISRHYKLSHEAVYETYDEGSRSEIVKELKLQLNANSPSTSTSQDSREKQSLAASYRIALLIAQQKKSFTDGDLIKTGAIEMAEAFNLPIAVGCFESASLSRQTISRRITDIGNYIKQKLIDLLSGCQYFSLCLDESTDNSDMSQLSVFVRFVQMDFEVREELLALIPLQGTTKGIDIYNALNKIVEEMIGGFEKCTSITTDGAAAMAGGINGLKGLLKQNGIVCPMFHCIIHQEALCGQVIKLSETMKIVTKATNMIRGGNRSLSHRKFRTFLAEVNAAYPDLPLHSEIRWLSAGKSLEQFFAMRGEISIFLLTEVKKSSEMAEKLLDDDFLQELAFLTDLTKHLNTLNLTLQRPEQNILGLFDHIKKFRHQINEFISELQKKEFHNFPSCMEIQEEFQGSELNTNSFISTFKNIKEQFEIRFKDFDEFQAELNLFKNPLKINISEQKPEFRQELCALQTDPSLINSEETGIDFFKVLSNNTYPRLRDFGLRITSMYGSTYSCESGFSTMNNIKSVHRSSLTNTSLSDLMRIALTKLEINISDIVEKKINRA